MRPTSWATTAPSTWRRDHRADRRARASHSSRPAVDLLTLVGGRAVHPVGMRVGGFYRVPTRNQARGPAADAGAGARRCPGDRDVDGRLQPARLRARPADAVDVRPRAIRASIPAVSSRPRALDIDPGDWDSAFTEQHVEHSTALQATSLDGKHHLLGPASRVVLAGGSLHPLAAQALDESGGTEVLRRNMFAAITARAVEMVHAAAESIAIIEAYEPPADAWTPWEPRAGKASWALGGATRRALPSLRGG